MAFSEEERCFLSNVIITPRSSEIKAHRENFFKNFRYAKNAAVRPHKRSDANWALTKDRTRT